MTPPSEGRSVRTGERFPGYTEPRKGGSSRGTRGPTEEGGIARKKAGGITLKKSPHYFNMDDWLKRRKAQ